MKFLKTLTITAMLGLFSVAAMAQDTTTTNVPELPTSGDTLRVWVGAGMLTGAERGFKSTDRSLGVAAGVYFPSKLTGFLGFHSFLGLVYNTAEGIETTESGPFDVTKWDLQFRFLYYPRFSNDKAGMFMTFGPDYEHVESEGGFLSKEGSLFQAAVGAGAYVGLGSSKNYRLSFVAERDFLGDIEHRDWRFLVGASTGFKTNLF